MMLDLARAAELLGNSAATAVIACFIALPAGVLFGHQLSRRRLVGATYARFLVLLGVCIPLPVTALAWQIVLSSWLPPLNLDPGEVAWRPWSRGLLPAGILHGIAAWPWVAGIVVAVLGRLDPALEDQARMEGGERAVLRRVLLPQLRLAVAIAGAWIAVQCFTEIPIADVMMVRTFAEEIYTQLIGAGGDFGPALAATLPASLVWVGIGFMLLNWIQRGSRPGTSISVVAGRASETSRAASAIAWTMLSLFVLLPIAALISRAAGASATSPPSLERFVAEVGRVASGEGPLLARSLLETAIAAIVLAGFAWAACWFVDGRRRAAYLLALGCLVLTALPGPLLGMMVKEAILYVVGWEAELFGSLGIEIDFPPVRSLLYDQPSPLPMMLAVWLRFFPLAVLMFLPAFHAIPKALWEAASLDGLGLRQRLRRVVWPHTAGMFRIVVPALTVLMLGEVSAVKIVNPPFHQVYILRLFDMMHYGAETTVAVLALGQIVAATVLSCLLQSAVIWPSSRDRRT